MDKESVSIESLAALKFARYPQKMFIRQAVHHVANEGQIQQFYQLVPTNGSLKAYFKTSTVYFHNDKGTLWCFVGVQNSFLLGPVE